MRIIELKHLGKLHRKNHYGDGVFDHPAKMHPELARWIIENHSERGDWMLDPMAGVGTTAIEGMLLGRNVMAMEIERQWAENISISVAMAAVGILPMGEVQVTCADARDPRSYRDPNFPVINTVITSPPYGIDMHGGGIANEQRPGGMRPYDMAVTSPPYGNRLSDEKVDDGDNGRIGYRQADAKNRNNLGNFLIDSHEYKNGMWQVYWNCYDAVKDGGKMIIVTKNFYYKGELKQLDKLTEALMWGASWVLEEHIKFKLPFDSMWQKMYAKKYPDREIVRHEDIQVFVKGSI